MTRPGRDRKIYLSGPKKGQARLGRRAKKRRRAQEQVAGVSLEESLEKVARLARLDCLQEGKAVDDEAGPWRRFRLCGVFKQHRVGPTMFPDPIEGSVMSGRLIVLHEQDVTSGRRWLRERVGSYRAEFVEVEGIWYEAEEVPSARVPWW